MKRKCGFETTDGKFFEDEHDAMVHQHELDEKARKEELRITMIQILVNSAIQKKKHPWEMGAKYYSASREYIKDILNKLQEFSYYRSYECNGSYTEGLRGGKVPDLQQEAVINYAAWVDHLFYSKKDLDKIKHLL